MLWKIKNKQKKDKNMGFRTYCDITYVEDGKEGKCREEMEPTIDKNTQEVFCACGRKMTNQNCVTEFAKRQMLAMGQVRRDEQKRQAYSVKCSNCQKENPPALAKDNSTLLCPLCNAELSQLNKPFAQLIRDNLRAQKKAAST